MKTRKLALIGGISLLIGILGVGGIATCDYFLSVKRWRTKAGCMEITGIDLPKTVTIRDYKVSAYYSLADRPNHRWLLESKEGFEALNIRVADFILGSAEHTEYLRDNWPELKPQYGSMKVGQIIMGVGSGEETLFISQDGRFAILYAFRT